jgi:intein/homing endonuclease
MKSTEAAYISGFFDGDGCVTFMDGKYRRPKLYFDQKDPEVLLKIQEMTGCGRLSSKHFRGVEYWRLIVVRQSEVKYLARLMVKYSVVKRKELRRALRNLQKPLYP